MRPVLDWFPCYLPLSLPLRVLYCENTDVAPLHNRYQANIGQSPNYNNSDTAARAAGKLGDSDVDNHVQKIVQLSSSSYLL